MNMNWGVVVLEGISNGCDFYKLIHTFTWNYAFIIICVIKSQNVSWSSRHIK